MNPGALKTGCVSDARASTCRFHRNWKPGFDNVSLEIRGSERTDAVRAPSPLVVVQICGPRPCASAAAGNTHARTPKQAAVRPRPFFMGTTGLGRILRYTLRFNAP